jgi:protein-L-isoaspartate(D-aspartate) O-methyltransferase
MENLSTTRRRYAELIRKRAGLRWEPLVNALSEVAREDFLGPGPWKIMRFVFPLKYEDTPDDNPARIYDDVLVALDANRGLNNGLPSGNTRWLDTMNIQQGEHVVHAGCGTGYYTALIAHMVTESGRVTAIEFDPNLANRALSNLGRYPQVEVIAGDATKYDPGPADAIFVNAGATHPCPLWVDSLKPSGRLVFPIIRWPKGSVLGVKGAGWGAMMRIERLQNGYEARWLSPCGFFPCLGAIDSEADQRLGDALARGGLNDARSLRREEHSAEQSCLLHGDGYCFSRLHPR